MGKKIFWRLIMGCFVMASENGFAMERALESKPLLLILLGPPGAGKGTHAAPLSDYLALPHVSTGDLFREHIGKRTAIGQTAKVFIDQGKLVPDELVLDMLFERLGLPDCIRGSILDGFPRTLMQAKSLDARLGNGYRVLVLNFRVPDSVLIERIAGRLVCRECKKTYHQVFDPPEEAGLCGFCGGELFMRNDDQEGIVRKRLEVYHQETEPVVDYYARKKDVFKEIDSENSKDQVFRDLLDALPSALKAVQGMHSLAK